MRKTLSMYLLGSVLAFSSNGVVGNAQTVIEQELPEESNIAIPIFEEDTTVDSPNMNNVEKDAETVVEQDVIKEDNIVELINEEDADLNNSIMNNSKVNSSSSAKQEIYEKNNVSVIINGQSITFDSPIINKSGYLLLPMRGFYEALGATVQWNQASKTVSSVRNGHTVDLTIHSNNAIVNGNSVVMDVAPLLYKDRTYVPLRFVSENLDGQVNWNEQKQTVDIILNNSEESPEIPIKPYIIYMDAAKIVMDEPIINKQGRRYIPAKYFADYLENSYMKWLSNDQIELIVSGMSFVFTDNSNTVYVKEQPITIEEKPFIQYGEMYVPVHFIVNSFEKGGSLRYDEAKQEMYISLYDYLFTSSFSKKSYGLLIVPEPIQNVTLEGKREFLMSDNPESLTPSLVPTKTATLAEYKVESTSPTKEHRVFGWHINNLSNDILIGITIQNTSTVNSIKIASSKGVAKIGGESWSINDVGLPIADTVLNEKLKKSTSEGIVIAPGETKVIETYNVHQGELVGFLHDLDISSVNGGKIEYTIRTVLSDEKDNLTTIHSEPLPIDQSASHPRGAWSSSTMAVTLPDYVVGSPEVGYSISNGRTDHLLTNENSFSIINGSVGNPGHFGMTYKINVPIVNDTGKMKVIKVKLAGRGGSYSGAIKMNGETYLIPNIKAGEEYVELPVFRTIHKETMINLEIMHAGGVNLPVAVYIETK